MRPVKIIFLAAVCLSMVYTYSYSQDIPSIFPQGSGGDFKKSAPVIVNGDKVRYLNDQKKIEADGNVRVNYGDVDLTCDKITVYTDEEAAKAAANIAVLFS